MKKKKASKLLSTLKYLDRKHIAAAVLDVFRYNQKYAEVVQGFPATADEWSTHSEMRRDVWLRARTAWCNSTKKDFTWFPYSEDYVARLYKRIAGRSRKTLAAWSAELKGAMT